MKMRFAIALMLWSAGTALSVCHAANAVLDTKAPCSKPEYPRSSLVNEEQGTVVLSLLVGTDGAASDAKIEKSSGFKNLDKAAQKALSNCKFKPTAKAEWQSLEYVWKLD